MVIVDVSSVCFGLIEFIVLCLLDFWVVGLVLLFEFSLWVFDC